MQLRVTEACVATDVGVQPCESGTALLWGGGELSTQDLNKTWKCNMWNVKIIVKR